MATRHTFPQSGDTDDAANFAQHLGRENISHYVEEGMGFTVDYSAPQVTVADGKANVLVDTVDASLAAETLHFGADHTVEFTELTESLVDNDFNYVWLDAQLDTDDSPALAHNTTGTPPTSDSLLIGTVDTVNNEHSLSNRDPTARFQALAHQDTIKAGDSFTVPAGYEMLVGPDFSVQGDLTVNGKLTQLEHPVDVEEFGTVRPERGLMVKNSFSGPDLTVPEGYTMFVPEDFDVDGNIDVQGELVTVAGQKGIVIDNIDNAVVTASGGSSPAFDGAVLDVSDEQTQKFDVVVSVDSAASFEYAYNTDISKHWTGSQWNVDVTINWDTDPGAGNDVDFNIETQNR